MGLPTVDAVSRSIPLAIAYLSTLAIFEIPIIPGAWSVLVQLGRRTIWWGWECCAQSHLP